MEDLIIGLQQRFLKNQELSYNIRHGNESVRFETQMLHKGVFITNEQLKKIIEFYNSVLKEKETNE